MAGLTTSAERACDARRPAPSTALPAALALALAGHVWLLGALSSPAPHVAGSGRSDAAPSRGAPVVVVELSDGPAAGSPSATVAPRLAPSVGPRRAAPSAGAETARPVRRPALPQSGDAAPADTRPMPGTGPPVTADDGGAASVAANRGFGDEPPAVDAASLPASPPPAATLHWRVDDRGRPGEATLEWRPGADGEYAAILSMRLDGRATATLEQRSEGRLDALGLQPSRFTDRRGGRAVRAATFVDDASSGVAGARSVSFSAVEGRRDAPVGAQDRLGALVQFVALHLGGALPEAIEQTVVDARGVARWRWRRLDDDDDGGAESAGSDARALRHWRRDPEHADGMRVEVWMDPRAGHWPRRIRYSFLRGGDAVEYTLTGIEEPSPAARPAMSASSPPGT